MVTNPIDTTTTAHRCIIVVVQNPVIEDNTAAILATKTSYFSQAYN
jgi:PPE-repeat protein